MSNTITSPGSGTAIGPGSDFAPPPDADAWERALADNGLTPNGSGDDGGRSGSGGGTCAAATSDRNGASPARPASDGGGWLGAVGGFAKGVGEGVWDGAKGMAEGVGHLAQGAWGVATDGGARQRAWEGAQQAAGAVGGFVVEAVTDPGQAASRVGDAASGAYDRFQAACQQAEASGQGAEFWGKLVGRGAFEVGTAVVPAGLAAKGLEGASLLGRTGKVGELLGGGARGAEAAQDARAAARGFGGSTEATSAAAGSEKGMVDLGDAASGAGATATDAARSSAAKLTFDPALDVVDRHMGVRAGTIIADDPIAGAHYGRLQAQGTDVHFIGDLGERRMGFFDGNRNQVTINLARHSSPQEVVSTLVHEATHQDRFFKGIPLGNQYEEYVAFRNEAHFATGVRPSLAERQQIWQHVKRLYPELPEGRSPFGGNP